MNTRKRNKRSGLRTFLIVLLVLVMVGVLIAYRFYQGIFDPNVEIINKEKNEVELFIPTGSTYDEVLLILSHQGILKNEQSFRLLAKKMNYPAHVHPGRYIILKGMSNYDLIRKLRSGESDPLTVTIDKVATAEEVAGLVGNVLELDSADIMNRLYNPDFLKEHGLNKNNVLAFFIPNSYEFYWNVNPDVFIEKMEKEYNTFWKKERVKRAREMNLSAAEIYILASIVQEEASVADEMPRIAGVYVNRLKKGMRLEADPTIKFLVRKRKNPKVELEDYKIQSPYNTYRNAGLPPGPIILARKESLLAVLNYEKHNYLFFVAKHDRSGYHVFSENYEQHKYYRKLYLKSK